jgi:prepilin-type N-terminal cleavage/methylation domain-containing protein
LKLKSLEKKAMEMEKMDPKEKAEAGFTLIEIIAVLIILGILAAVAVPKYLDLQTDAKVKAAQGQLAEVKGTLSTAWGKYMIRTAGNPAATIPLVRTEAGLAASNTLGTAPDIWTFTVGDDGAIAVVNRNGDAGYATTGQWNLPQ